MAGGAQKGAARPGSAGYVYRHGWIPVAGSGAVDKRSKAKQQANPSDPVNPAYRAETDAPVPAGTSSPAKRNPDYREMGTSRLDSTERMMTALATRSDTPDDARAKAEQILRDIRTEKAYRLGANPTEAEAAAPLDLETKPVEIAPAVTTRSAAKQSAKVERSLQKDPAEVAQSTPEHTDPENPEFKATHVGLYHATPGGNVESIKADGFRSTSGTGENGAFFGVGTYFHTKQKDAKESIEGYKMFIDSTMEHVVADAQVDRPFVVRASGSDMDPGAVMHRAMVDAGLAARGARLDPQQMTDRLKRAGYDGVEVKQSGFNHEIGGSQLVVFDAARQTSVAGGKKSSGGESPKPTGVNLDMVSKQRGLVTFREHNVGGNLLREDGMWLAENDDGDVVGEARTKDKAVAALADHYGIKGDLALGTEAGDLGVNVKSNNKVIKRSKR